MPRNPKNPREYSVAPRNRAAEKLDTVLRMLIDFHHSTKELILMRLGLAPHSHHRYFTNLQERNILRKIAAPSIRSNGIYMLTPIGVELAAERIPTVINYSTDINKINHYNLRHDLAIQKAVFSRLEEYNKFTPERYLPLLDLGEEKRPDGCLEKEGIKTMLEVELTAKTDQRIFRALVSHARALLKGHYQKVLYVFPTATLTKYYQERFTQAQWPCYRKNEIGIWLKETTNFQPGNHPELAQAFSFITQTDLIKGL